MAKKKFYAVRKGITIGVFESWSECQAATAGYSNAEFKSFSTLEEAESYIKNESPVVNNANAESFELNTTKVIAYVDGSYDDKLKKYAFGCVILTPSGETIKEHGNGENPASLAIRNVAALIHQCLVVQKVRHTCHQQRHPYHMAVLDHTLVHGCPADDFVPSGQVLVCQAFHVLCKRRILPGHGASGKSKQVGTCS